MFFKPPNLEFLEPRNFALESNARDVAECHPNDSVARVGWLGRLVGWLVGLVGLFGLLLFLSLLVCFVYIKFAGHFNSTWLFATYLFGLYMVMEISFKTWWFITKNLCLWPFWKWKTSQPTTIGQHPSISFIPHLEKTRKIHWGSTRPFRQSFRATTTGTRTCRIMADHQEV